MVKFSPIIRIALTGLAAAIGVIAATVPHLPTWAAAVIVGADTILAGFGIIPPHIPVHTVVTDRSSPGQVTPNQ